MDLDILKSLGEIAGIAGIAVGVLLFVFRGVLQNKVFARLGEDRAYRLFRLMIVSVLAIAVLGIAAWIVPGFVAERAPSTGVQAASIMSVLEKRTRDLRTATENVDALLRGIEAGTVGPADPYNRINDLNNQIIDLWKQIASYGLGTDPTYNSIMVETNGSITPEPAPTYGEAESFVARGMPNLFEAYVKATAPNQATRQVQAFRSAVSGYANPAVFPLLAVCDRAYASYRNGAQLDTPLYVQDLAQVRTFVNRLETALGSVQELLNKAAAS